MEIPNWTNLDFYQYLVFGGGGVILVALVLYFTPISRLRMPAVFLGVFGGLAAGVAAGVLLMGLRGYRLEQLKNEEAPDSAANAQAKAKAGNGPQRAPRGTTSRAGGPGGGPNRGGGGGNSKTQLALLISKLDVLTHKPLQLTLDAKQKQKIEEQIGKLDEKEELSEEKAKEALDGLLAVLKDQKDTLEGAGFRWPGQQGGGGGRGGRGAQQPANPFREGPNSVHLKALRQRLEDKKAT